MGGIQRAYAADIAPDDSYFVVGSGSGGDRPPINDTVVRFPINGGANVEPDWISRHFDSVYSVAVTEQGIYAGGHFAWNESPTARDPWPGLDEVGYGTGQGLSGYGLGDEVVRREHLGLLDPATGTCPGVVLTVQLGRGREGHAGHSGRPARSAATATTKGGFNVGRIEYFDFSTIPARQRHQHHDRRPDRGPGEASQRGVHRHRHGDRHQRRQPGRAHGLRPADRSATSLTT